jgi:predicted phage tail protein
MALIAGANYGLQRVFAKKQESKPTYDNTENSPNYGWDGIQNTSRNGEPIALVYGRHKVAGQYLATFTKSTHDGKEKLYVLIGLCAGPVGAINGYTESIEGLSGEDAGQLKINANSAANFSGLSVAYRMGEWDQSIIEGFNDSTPEYTVDSDLAYDVSVPYTTEGKVDAFEVKILFPGGIYGLDANGAIFQYSVAFEIKYRADGAGPYTTETHTVSAQTRSRYAAYISVRGLDNAEYEIEVKRTTADDDSFHVSTSKFQSIKEITIDDVSYKGVALEGVQALGTEQLNGRLPTYTSVVDGKECRVYQPGDDFCEDAEQELIAYGDGKRLNGWYVDNTAKLTAASIHTNYADHLVLLHDAATSAYSAWTTRDAPLAFKRIYGDFDATAKIEFHPAAVTGTTITMIARFGETNLWFYIGVKALAGGLYQWVFQNNTAGISVETTGSCTSSEIYYRILHEDDEWTCYTSTDGETWTERASITYEQPTHSEYVELGFMVMNQYATASGLRASEFAFSDSTSYSIETSANPSWVVYDLLTDTHYGLGDNIETTEIDLDSFIDFAAYGNELVSNGKGGLHRRYRFDGLLDSSDIAWEKLLKLLDNYRATLLEQGNVYRVAWRRERDPVQPFAMSNIVAGSFRVIDQTPKLNANYWEIQFLNRELDYDQDFIPYPDPGMESGEPYRRKTIEMYGITREAEAYRAAIYQCKTNRYCTEQVEFRAGIDAVGCQPLDVISVQHDMPQWGTGAGRVISAGATAVVLDRVIDLAEDTTYVIKIRHKTDEYETQTVTNEPGETNTITVAEWDRTPEPSAIWIVGEENIATKEFEVVDIEISGDQHVTITAVNYDARIFDDTIENLPFIKYSELPDPRAIPADVAVNSLRLTERAQVMSDGSVTNVVDVTWGEAKGAQTYEIYYRVSGQTEWLYGGFSRGLHHVLQALFATGYWYDIGVVSVGPWGAKKDPSLAPYTSLEIKGRTTRPSDVTGLSAAFIRNMLIVKWDPIADADLKGYELRKGTEDDWTTATHIIGPYAATSFVTSDIAPGTWYFLVKAINTSGLYSENAASVQATIDFAQDETATVEREESANSWNGSKTNCTVDGSDLVLDEGETSFTYETPELDALSDITGVARCTVQVVQFIPDTLTINEVVETVNSAWSQATYINAAEDSPGTHFVLSYRSGNSSGNLGAYTEVTEDTQIVKDLSGRYYQFRLVVTVNSTGYSAKAIYMQSSVAEYA